MDGWTDALDEMDEVAEMGEWNGWNDGGWLMDGEWGMPGVLMGTAGFKHHLLRSRHVKR